MNTPNDPKGAIGATKTPLALIPPFAMEQTAWTTYVAAIMRHLNAWRDGEDLDPESGISHIAHIACSCNILLDAQHCNTLQDDRYKKPENPHCGSEFIAEEFGVETGRPPEDKMECLCGRRLIYTWNMGWACEDCHL